MKPKNLPPLNASTNEVPYCDTKDQAIPSVSLVPISPEGHNVGHLFWCFPSCCTHNMTNYSHNHVLTMGSWDQLTGIPNVVFQKNGPLIDSGLG